MTEVVVGCKLLTPEGQSLRAEGRVQYRRGEWVTVPGHGAYVAVTGGIALGGIGHVLAYMECEEPTGSPAPAGVVCYRRVRWVDPCPERIAPELRGEVARYAPDLTPDQRVELAMQSTPDWRGRAACRAPGLSADQRYALAQASTPEMRGEVACYATDIDPEQRVALAMASTPDWRWQAARHAPGLAPDQRVDLAVAATPVCREAAAADREFVSRKEWEK